VARDDDAQPGRCTSARTAPDDAPPDELVLERIAKSEAPVLRNLFELYAHDFSEYVPLELHANGRFDVVPDEKWWTSPEHFPFFIRWNGKLSGFALVRRGSRVTGAADVMDMAEFFVLRGARGNRVGTRAAHALFATFPGAWEIRVRRANAPASKFWESAAAGLRDTVVVSIQHRSDGVDWDVLRFTP